MKTLFVVAAVSLFTLRADSPEAQVEAAEKAWAKATTTNDYATLEKLLAPELVYTHSNGEADSKQVFIDNLKNNVRKYHDIVYDKMSVKVVGNTAIVNVTGKLKVTTRGNLGEVKVCFLHVFIKRGSSWQLLAHQSARI
ncbi:MAG: nuclear transport factor 2 family protein [Bryobacteraceae bacterium]|nr:nuclear transport factor 2 family protein [Bryobacteraceae bacterium]MDW8378596.1 nuclear transport factor 2 family protein [Bryobacterales bacterium]